MTMNESLYNLCSANSEEAKILYEKIDLFSSEQLSFHGKVEEFINYVLKDKDNIIAGPRCGI
jgi:hypothetical protein